MEIFHSTRTLKLSIRDFQRLYEKRLYGLSLTHATFNLYIAVNMLSTTTNDNEFIHCYFQFTDQRHTADTGNFNFLNPKRRR
jgi:hypothetical protein